MENSPARTALLVENDPEQARLIGAMLKGRGPHAFKLACTQSMSDAETYLATHSVNVVLLDLPLSDPDCLRALRRVRALAPSVSIVILSSPEEEPIAIQAINEGAQDYLIKGRIEPQKLIQALDNALERMKIERMKIEAILLDQKERAQATLECIADAVICTSVSGNISFLNPVAERMTGWSLNDAAGRPFTEAIRIVDAASRKTILNPMAKATSEDRTGKLPLNSVLIRRDGNEVFIEDSVAPIHGRDGNVTGAVIVFRDVRAARAQAEQIAHSAEHDFLTGLPNRLLFNDRLGQAISLARRNGRQAALLFLDLDGFKLVNDSLGHLAGDKLLQSVAKRLLGCVRAPDTVSRYGGDEFAILLQDVKQPEDAAVAATRVSNAMREVFPVDGQQLRVTASIGVSIYPVDGKNGETLIRNADAAMYRARKNGRQICQFYNPEMNDSAVECQFTAEDLRRALERNEFTLHYQPKIDLKTGAISGTEALSRWIHPTRGSILPGRFIPVAEESGLALPIGNWVLREACAQAQAWAQAGMPTKSITVNISETQFRSEDFPGGLSAILSETGLDPRSLELDLTEIALIRHPERTAFILKTLRGMGVRVSVDNFGTGHSALTSMQKLPLDALKIDRSLVHQMAKATDGSPTLGAIVNMGRSLNLRVIAAGVETAEDLESLWAHNCDEAQGHFFGRPVPPEQLTRLLQPQRSLTAMAS